MLAAQFTQIQVGSYCPGAVCRGRKDEWAGLQTLSPWADNSGKVPVAKTKCPYPEWPESANHKGLKTAWGMAYGERPEAGQTAKKRLACWGWSADLERGGGCHEMLGWEHRV